MAKKRWSSKMQDNDLRKFVEEYESLGEATPGIPFFIKLPFIAGLVIVVYWFFVWVTGSTLVYFLPAFGICLGIACRLLGDSSQFDRYLTVGVTFMSGLVGVAGAFPFENAHNVGDPFWLPLFDNMRGFMLLYMIYGLEILPLVLLFVAGVLAYYLGFSSRKPENSEQEQLSQAVSVGKIIFKFPSAFHSTLISFFGGLLLLITLTPALKSADSTFWVTTGVMACFAALPILIWLFSPRLVVQPTGATLFRGPQKMAELPIEQWQRIQVMRETSKIYKPRGSYGNEFVTRFKYHVFVYGDGLPIPFPKTDSDKKLYQFLCFLNSRFVGEAIPPTPQFQGLLVAEKQNRSVWVDWNVKAKDALP
jgi:positive regulator of sigma E activity